MRVLIIIPDKVSYGGTSRFLERLLLYHDRQGIETALLMPAHLCDDAVISLATRNKVAISTAANRTREHTSPFLTPIYDFVFAWRTVCSWRPDLLVISTGDPGRMSIALYLPVPAFYMLHSSPEQVFRLLPRLYLRVGAWLNNRIVTVSKSAAQTIANTMGFSLKSIAVVYNSSPAVPDELEGGLPVVVTAGHLVSYKNPHGWLEVAKTVLRKRADVTFVWLGDGEFLDDMRGMVKSLGLQERILLPGFVPDLSRWLAGAQLYFQPSLRESHGIAVLEAMARRLPCVVADTGGLPESVIDNETGFVCPASDVAGFAGRILDLLADPILRERMGTAGRLRVERHFSEKKQEQQIMALYDQLVKKARTR